MSNNAPVNEQPLSEVERLDRARVLLSEWVGKQDHDRCWYYPDIFLQLCDLFGVEVSIPERVPRMEFERGCRQYQDEEYGDLGQAVGSMSLEETIQQEELIRKVFAKGSP